MRLPELQLLGSFSTPVRGLVVKNGVPRLVVSGEEGDYPALRLSGGYLKAGAPGRKLTLSNGLITCNDSATV